MHFMEWIFMIKGKLRGFWNATIFARFGGLNGGIFARIDVFDSQR